MYKGAALLIIGLFVCGASGATISFDLGVEISGAADPVGDPPWLTATFDDGDSAGSVDLTLITTNLSPGEYVAKWLFNLDPDLKDDLGDLTFTPLPKTGFFEDPIVSTLLNGYKADGDGYFDIKFEFSFQNGDSASIHRFDDGDEGGFTITGIPSLTAGSFNFISEPNGRNGEYETVSHVQGIGEYSGWVGTPEPTTLVLLALGGVAMLRRRRKFG